ncbi:SDR family oxidoreductase [Frondihabitans australicus]|uniref:NADP-dependent 3-hydroxy acid dehydrogenase YdfG n=1 Tax=Frondihabitans australicus TaxID=386892 RepID=A0A495IC37_9MICO|nr:SDR family oxidoreductase [Frondihabitans australicus]RKR73563.1 NADP-dependent 3-hydroxy acid dehydrogenase YdfG [Frondihabitans australicus]
MSDEASHNAGGQQAGAAAPGDGERPANAGAQEQRGVAVVTGGGSGIGRAAALELANDGWTVVIAGRRREALDEVAGESGRILPLVADVTREDDVVRLFDETVRRFGRVDLLFNNAGAGAPPTDLDRISLETWQAVMDVTVTGSFLCAREAFRVMRAQTPQGGRIITNGSISAYAPRPLSAPYTVAKHAVSGLTKQIQLDGRPFGISGSQIDIGNAVTPMTAGSSAGSLQADGSVRVEPTIDVAETGRAVLYMANQLPGVNVANLTIMPPAMPLVGRG